MITILKASVGIGTGSNNYAKLKTLKILLCWLRKLGIASTHIFGDSMNVINWSNNMQRCQNLTLIPILDEISFIKSTFVDLSVCHIYRERNMEADYFSKKGLQQALDTWHIIDLDNGMVIESDRPPYF